MEGTRAEQTAEGAMEEMMGGPMEERMVEESREERAADKIPE